MGTDRIRDMVRERDRERDRDTDRDRDMESNTDRDTNRDTDMVNEEMTNPGNVTQKICKLLLLQKLAYHYKIFHRD
jgi:hypothetical protein